MEAKVPSVSPQASEKHPHEGVYVTINEMAAMASMNASTIRKWITAGKIKAYGNERVVRVLVSEVLAIRPVTRRSKDLRVRHLRKGRDEEVASRTRLGVTLDS